MKRRPPLRPVLQERSLSSLAAQLMLRRLELEDELVIVVAQSPLKALREAEAEGMDASLIVGDDRRLIYLAAVTLMSLGRLTGRGRADLVRVCRLARRGLADEGRWQDGMPRTTRGPKWSDESLAAFVLRPVNEEPGALVRRIRELDARLNRAAQQLQMARQLLAGDPAAVEDLRDQFADGLCPSGVDPVRWGLSLARVAHLTEIPVGLLYEAIRTGRQPVFREERAA